MPDFPMAVTNGEVTAFGLGMIAAVLLAMFIRALLDKRNRP